MASEVKLGNNDTAAPWWVVVTPARRDRAKFYAGFEDKGEAESLAAERNADMDDRRAAALAEKPPRVVDEFSYSVAERKEEDQ